MHGRYEKCYKIFVGKSEQKRPFKRPGHRWEDSIKVDLREIAWEVVNRVMNLQIPYKGAEFLDQMSDY
jgi:hypothetical protein